MIIFFFHFFRHFTTLINKFVTEFTSVVYLFILGLKVKICYNGFRFMCSEDPSSLLYNYPFGKSSLKLYKVFSNMSLT